VTLRPYSATVQANFRDVMATPAAPEAFDDETPLMPTVDVSLQKDTESVLQVAGKALLAAGQTVTNATTTLFTAGANGARIHSLSLSNINGVGNGVSTITVGGVVVYSLNAFNSSALTGSIHLGTNFIQVSAGQLVQVTSPNVNVTAAAVVWYRQL